MSLKNIQMTDFYRSLHDRGLTTDNIAERIGVSGGAVRRLLANHRKRRGPIWRAIIGLLNEKERKLLLDTSRVEQCSTCNTKHPVFTDAVREALRKPAQRS